MSEETRRPFDDKHGLVATHLTILQSVITRMAANSSAAKTWCVTIVAAMLVAIVDKNKPQLIWLAAFPVPVLFVLDLYYLALERQFRSRYTSFVRKLQQQKLTDKDIEQVKPEGQLVGNMLAAAVSFSVWPFYGTIVGTIYLAIRLLNEP